METLRHWLNKQSTVPTTHWMQSHDSHPGLQLPRLVPSSPPSSVPNAMRGCQLSHRLLFSCSAREEEREWTVWVGVGMLEKFLESPSFFKPHIKVNKRTSNVLNHWLMTFIHHFLWIYKCGCLANTFKTFETGFWTVSVSKMKVMASAPMEACKFSSLWQPKIAHLPPWATGSPWM